MRKRVVLILLVLLFIAVSIPVAVTMRPGSEATAPPAPEHAAPPEPSGEDAPDVPDPNDAEAEGAGPGGPESPGTTGKGNTGSRDPVTYDQDPDTGYFTIIAATVVDVGTGDPVVGAKIAYGTGPDKSWGATTNAKGWFQLTLPSGPPLGKPWRLRVTATGYEAWETVPRKDFTRVELIPTRYVLRPGRIGGRALDHDGRPLTGVVRIALRDSKGFSHWLVVHADENGEFRLEGIAPGGYTIRHVEGTAVDVFVPEDAEAPVTIRSKKTREELAREPERAEYIRKQKDFLQFLLAALRTETRPEVREKLMQKIALTELQLKNATTVLPRRDVPVKRLRAPDGTRLVCESHGAPPTERWWAVVVNGEARFPALHPGRWTFTLKLASGDVSSSLDVPGKGDVIWPK